MFVPTILASICLYCLKLTKFGQLTTRKILETVTCRMQISDFKAKMHQSQFQLGFSTPDPTGELTALPRSLTGFKGSYF